MKLITFQILLISFSVPLYAKSGNQKKCAVMDFETKDIFDTAAEKIGLRKLGYEAVSGTGHCYVSFQLRSIPSGNFSVNEISDCSQHFDNGKIRAGAYPKKLPSGFKSTKCYYQHSWVFCVCTPTHCNSPQYWPLILARSLLTGKVAQYNKSIGTKLRNGLKWTDSDVTVHKTGNVTNFQCFMWLADTVGQEEYNPPFYLYNYITTRHNAPPLADALTKPARLRFKKHNKPPKVRQYIEEEEPFEDGTMSMSYSSGDGDDDEEVPAEIVKMSKIDELPDIGPTPMMGTVIMVVAAFGYLVALGGTVHMLRKFCRELKDHTHFIRKRDNVTLLRYERLYAADTIPKEFTRKKKGGKKKKTMGSPKKHE